MTPDFPRASDWRERGVNQESTLHCMTQAPKSSATTSTSSDVSEEPTRSAQSQGSGDEAAPLEGSIKNFVDMFSKPPQELSLHPSGYTGCTGSWSNADSEP